MSGITLVASVLATNGLNFTVTVAVGANFVGFNPPSGAISPTSLKSQSFDLCSTISGIGAADFSISLNTGGSVASTFFRAALVQRTNGTWIRYETSAASFDVGASTWRWGDGSSPVWSSAGTRSVIIFV